MKVKTAELRGAALDWAVAMAEGWHPDRPQDGQIRRYKDPLMCSILHPGDYKVVGAPRLVISDRSVYYSPSTDWAVGGPIFDRRIVSLRYSDEYAFDGWIVEAYAGCADDVSHAEGRDENSKLIAFCRAFVRAKFGDEVEIPHDLCEVPK